METNLKQLTLVFHDTDVYEVLKKIQLWDKQNLKKREKQKIWNFI